MEIELEHRLTEVESRSKSNTHRIDNLEQSTKAITSIATSVEVMATELKHQTTAMAKIETDVAKLDSKVETMEQKPAKRWEGLVDKALWAIVGAAIAYALAQVGF